MIAPANNKGVLGNGVYILSEVARFTGMPSSTASAWFRWRSDLAGQGPVFGSDYETVDGDFAVSFLDLVDVLVARQFRREGVKLKMIRRAYDILKDDLGTSHPFCHGALYTDGKNIIKNTASKVGDDDLNDVVSKQKLFSYMANCLSRIEYRQDTQLARRWRISEGVVIDPQIGWGKPSIEGTGIHAAVIARYYRANNDRAGLVADLFNISETAVTNAVSFARGHGVLSAA